MKLESEDEFGCLNLDITSPPLGEEDMGVPSRCYLDSRYLKFSFLDRHENGKLMKAGGSQVVTFCSAASGICGRYCRTAFPECETKAIQILRSWLQTPFKESSQWFLSLSTTASTSSALGTARKRTLDSKTNDWRSNGCEETLHRLVAIQ